jgi:DNA mismatch endonuclease (patch repair protein)
MDVLTKEQRSKNMRSIRSADTKMEIRLAKALWSKGLRYRKNVSKVFGKPDIVFKKHKIAIFVDSEYFHGKDWEIKKNSIQTNQAFWWNKIEKNITRDSIVNEKLKNTGWQVLRFWSKDIEYNLEDCLIKIELQIKLND